MKLKVLILQGIQGAGKSTFAKSMTKDSLEWVRINRDDLRNMSGDYWVLPRENYISDIERGCIREAMDYKYNIIIDSMNLGERRLKELNAFIKLHKNYDLYEIETKLLDTPLEECIKRDALREKPIGEDVIRKTHAKYF